MRVSPSCLSLCRELYKMASLVLWQAILAAWAKQTFAVPAKCGSEEEDNGEDLDESNCLVGVEEVEGGFGEGCLGVEIEVLATAHLYLGAQSKTR